MSSLSSPHPLPLTFRRAHPLARGSPPSNESRIQESIVSNQSRKKIGNSFTTGEGEVLHVLLLPSAALALCIVRLRRPPS